MDMQNSPLTFSLVRTSHMATDAEITKKYGCESNMNFPEKTRHYRRQVQMLVGNSSLPHLRLLIASNSPKGSALQQIIAKAFASASRK